MKINVYLLSIVVLYICTQCESFVEVDPPRTKPGDDLIFQDSLTASSAINGVYSDLVNKNGGVSGKLYSMPVLLGLASDEFSTTAPLLKDYYNNSITGNDSANLQLFANSYFTIYSSNAILENVYRLKSQKGRFVGESLFIRAFSYFYLVNFFGDVPYTTTTDLKTNLNQERVSEDIIYEHIIQDLITAKSLLSKTYITPERTYPSYWAATALLARVYLYRREWNKALIESSELVDNGFFILEPIEKVFSRQSQETIYQWESNKDKNTWAGTAFILPRDLDTLECKCKNPVPPDNLNAEARHNKIWLSDQLLNSFDPNDLRLKNWVRRFDSNFDNTRKYFFPVKYKGKQTSTPTTEHYVVFRMAEQYFIAAEAKAHLGDIAGAVEHINKLRYRCDLPSLSASSYNEIMAIIEQEKRIEFFAEWGHRWIDVKRWNKGVQVYSHKPGYSDTDQLLPIPWSEIRVNGWQQNPGY